MSSSLLPRPWRQSVHLLTSPCKCQASIWEEYSSDRGLILRSTHKIRLQIILLMLSVSNVRRKRRESISNYKEVLHWYKPHWLTLRAVLKREHWSRESMSCTATARRWRCWMIETVAAGMSRFLMLQPRQLSRGD